jgi:hypothetical protein
MVVRTLTADLAERGDRIRDVAVQQFLELDPVAIVCPVSWASTENWSR